MKYFGNDVTLNSVNSVSQTAQRGTALGTMLPLWYLDCSPFACLFLLSTADCKPEACFRDIPF